MTHKLPCLVSLFALLIATPALAQTTLTLDSSAADPGGVKLSAPPNFSMSLQVDESSSTPPPKPSSSKPPKPSSSAEPPLSHMSTPPVFSSSEDQTASSEDETSSDDQTSSDDETDSDESSTPSGPPVASDVALKLFYDSCTDISGGDKAAYDRANNNGWIANDNDDAGPYNSIYSASRQMDGYGEVDIWGSVQSFPTQTLGYCRVDLPDADNLIDFGQMSKIGGLKGKIEDRGDGNVFGTWESADKKLLIIGDRSEGQVEIEYNILLGDAKK
jgi:hypothetical protein